MTLPTYDGYGDGWITSPDDPRLAVLWPGGTDYYTGEVDDGFGMLLYVARVQCEEFAPALAAEAVVPENYVAAQVLQARALSRAGMAGSGDADGGFGQTVTVFPMDWTVKALLRPRQGKPKVH